MWGLHLERSRRLPRPGGRFMFVVFTFQIEVLTEKDQ